MFCGKCGNEVPPHARFCNACGHRIADPHAATEPAHVPESEPDPSLFRRMPEESGVDLKDDAAPLRTEPVRGSATADAVPEPLFPDDTDPDAPSGRKRRTEKTRNRYAYGQQLAIPADEAEDEPVFLPGPEPELPAENRPLSPWAYFGYALLFLIPLLGLIPVFIFSFIDGNVNRRNYARSFLCGLIPALAIVLIILILLLTGILKGPIEAAIVWIRDVALPWISRSIG